MKRKRCSWAEKEVFHAYHDNEWGRMVTNEHTYFEFLILEGAQAGLSWETILKRRDGYKKAFAQFDPQKVARFSTKKVDSLLQDVSIIRNRLKVESVIKNASVFLDIQKEFGSFHLYVWQFVNNTPLRHISNHYSEIPVTTPESDALSKDLKNRGCSFVGSTIMYAYMQAVGLANDHERSCYRSKQP